MEKENPAALQTLSPASSGKSKLQPHRIVTSSQFIVLCLLIIVWIVGSITAPAMLQRDNLINVIRGSAITGMFALAATLVLLVGEIDLSLGSTMVFALIIGSKLYGVTSDIVMIIATLVAGALLGLFNGIVITVFKVKSLMATLGTMSLFGGLAYFLSSGKVALFYQAPNYLWMGKGMILGIPVPVVFSVVIFVVLFIFLHLTKFGKEVYFTGANPLAAWMSGVNIKRIKLIIFVLAGLFATLGGLFQSALLNEVGPSYGAGGYEMTGLSIAIFGGTSMAGGKGSILSTALAAITFQLLLNVLTLSGLGTYMEQVFKGLFLIIIVISFQNLERKRYAKL